jgi:hypothetical protein
LGYDNQEKGSQKFVERFSFFFSFRKSIGRAWRYKKICCRKGRTASYFVAFSISAYSVIVPKGRTINGYVDKTLRGSGSDLIITIEEFLLRD